MSVLLDCRVIGKVFDNNPTILRCAVVRAGVQIAMGWEDAYLPVRSSPAIQKAGWSSVSKALHSAVVTRADV